MIHEMPELPALDAFLNAALREGSLAGARLAGDRLCIPTEKGDLVFSVAGRALFRNRFRADVRLAGHQIGIGEALALLARPYGAVFAARVIDSLTAIRRAPPPESDDPRNWSFQQAESALRAGHPCHPNPRSRDEMDAGDARRYAPEFGASFALVWLAVSPDGVVASPGAAKRLAELAHADGAPEAAAPDLVRLPIHPWQAEQEAERIAAAGAQVIGQGKAAWRATASMRTLHAWHAPVMLKGSLSLRLTNSCRVLQPREMQRGSDLAALLAGPVGDSLRVRFPQMHILREADHAALADKGEPISETLISLRDNPFHNPHRPGPVMLASLCEATFGRPSPLVRLIRSGEARLWFCRFLRIAVLPLLEIRASYGLLFGAHQQNMMIRLHEDGMPVSVWLRDCQGTGHIDHFHDTLAVHCPTLGAGADNIVSADLGDRLLTYYLVVNGVMHLLSTLALDGLADEGDLLRDWRDFLVAARRDCGDDRTLYDKLLEGEELTCKGNFETSRRSVNEADGGSDGQLASFLTLPNPIAFFERTTA
ncbi:IucA/IucC family siderophore biosynthesis protein [Sedimentitalea sp. XS_ASV28]|uniref:IucA/IucC family protein n=1 Tax=Sedimentitalea sp. XS_ASV28 TaxID=3241296 RepID=UPI0035139963